MKQRKLLAFILSLIFVIGVCLCPVSAAISESGIVHNIAEKYSAENLVDDPNMMWFVPDLAVYEQVYQKSVITPVIEQKCLDKIIAEADSATYPSSLAKSIISLRALGYDAKDVITADLTSIDVVKKLTDLIDSNTASVFNEYTLPYVIIALQQGHNYATEAQMNLLISKAIETKAAWQDTMWGTDAATPMLLALAPYYSTNEQVKDAIDETLPIVTAFQDETGLISNAASHGLAMAAFSALGIDNHSVTNAGKDMFDGLMTTATPDLDGFEPSYNSFSTEQGFRGLLSTMLPAGQRIYDFKDYPYNQAVATWAEFAPVTFEILPADATVTISGATPVSANKFDLNAGTYNYSVVHSVYQPSSGTIIITPEEAENHIPKTVSVILAPYSSSGGGSDTINVKVKVMAHSQNACNNSFTYKNNSSSYTAIANETVTLNKGSSVLSALKKVLDKNNISYVERNGYVSEINNIKEFDHGSNSGWMFTVDGVHSTKGSSETKISSGQEIVWFYTDNYNAERGSEGFRPSSSSSATKENKWGLDGKNPDIRKREVEIKGKTFDDIKNHKNKSEISALAERKIINGKDETRFDPDGFMTRSEFATIIVNGLCLPKKTGKEFKDVSGSDWFFNYIGTAYAYGIIKGESDTEFNPNGTITREEAVTMLARTAKLCGMDTQISSDGTRNILAAFTDYTTVSEWAQSSLAFCYSKKILSDEAMEIKPSECVTRAEIAVMLYNMLSLSKLL